jgi:flagellar biosynthesis GTPase FlhF
MIVGVNGGGKTTTIGKYGILWFFGAFVNSIAPG